MLFHIVDETSPLDKVIVAWGTSEAMRQQQEKFFSVLRSYGAEPLFADSLPGDVHQPYTRDIGFVYGDTFFYNLNRTLPERGGEFSAIQQHLQWQGKVIEIKEGRIEGGDVLVTPEKVYVGISARTDQAAIDELEDHFPPGKVEKLYLGSEVMHLDTRLAFLPRDFALLCPQTFRYHELHQLQQKFEPIEVTEKEAYDLATNVFVINPQTIVVHEQHQRIRTALRDRGFAVEPVDYSELMGLQGSFHCTTLPIARRR